MKKQILAVLGCSAICLTLGLTAKTSNQNVVSAAEAKTVTLQNVKVGFIFLHDTSSSYDKNFIDAANEAATDLGLQSTQVLMATGIEEGQACADKAEEFVSQGCDIIFADSFGHEPYMLQTAKDNPNVQFYHATGVKAHTEKVANYHNAFADIYQGRYLTGIAAGYKLNEMINKGDITADKAIMGYVGAFPYAEVVSGYTSFYLGAKSVCPSVKMAVRYTNSWYDVTGEKTAALALIEQDKAVLISQHADSQGAPTACEEKGVPNVFYNGTNTSKETYLIASKINWAPFMKEMIKASCGEAEAIGYDYTGKLTNDADSAVQVLEIGNAADATLKATIQNAIADAKTGLINGTINVFDTSKFTVNGNAITTYLADVDDDGTFTGETEVIDNGIFKESKFRSAPYFDLRIDGITEVSSNDDSGETKGGCKGATIPSILGLITLAGALSLSKKRNSK